MNRQDIPFAEVAAGLDVTDAMLGENELVEGAVVLLKTSTSDGSSLQLLSSSGLSVWERRGMLLDAVEGTARTGWFWGDEE